MRLFFAYWPDADTAEEIVPWVEKAHALYGGRMMRTDTLHMTLAFLGETDDDLADRLAESCRDWELPSGSMVLREPGCFSNAKVVWLGPQQESPDALTWLHDANWKLWSLLEPFGWKRREPTFRPHVSLLRNAAPAELTALKGPAVNWTPDKCVLVGSQPTNTGSHYTVLAQLPLRH